MRPTDAPTGQGVASGRPIFSPRSRGYIVQNCYISNQNNLIHLKSSFTCCKEAEYVGSNWFKLMKVLISNPPAATVPFSSGWLREEGVLRPIAVSATYLLEPVVAPTSIWSSNQKILPLGNFAFRFSSRLFEQIKAVDPRLILSYTLFRVTIVLHGPLFLLVHFCLKIYIYGFSSALRFLLSTPNLADPLLLGSDFLVKRRIVLDILNSYFVSISLL
jgi:hypothetical protein